MSKPKTHLCNSDEPLKEGETLTAICGQEVPRATFVLMWDGSETGLDLFDPNIMRIPRGCAECRRIGQSLDYRYIYGVRTREESDACPDPIRG